LIFCGFSIRLVIENNEFTRVQEFSAPPRRLALEANLFNPNATFFDYGCGLGGDVKQVESRGYISNGWDPYYRPETIPATADIVNIGYIINVIESQAERREALIRA
jgi:DNA phosphorothioation-associated putative methyltransferase